MARVYALDLWLGRHCLYNGGAKTGGNQHRFSTKVYAGTF